MVPIFETPLNCFFRADIAEPALSQQQTLAEGTLPASTETCTLETLNIITCMQERIRVVIRGSSRFREILNIEPILNYR